jgi:hypothetical protein
MENNDAAWRRKTATERDIEILLGRSGEEVSSSANHTASPRDVDDTLDDIAEHEPGT